jgi:hypothetical protein
MNQHTLEESVKFPAPRTIIREDLLGIQNLEEDDEPSPEVTEDIEPLPLPAKCPHGNECGECFTCDYLFDLAYDAQRENRWR